MKRNALLPILVILIMVSVGLAGPVSSGADSGHEISVEGEHGIFTDSQGNPYNGGTFSGKTTLTFTPIGGYEFIQWGVKGKCQYVEHLNHITITAVSGNITISAETRNYSTSHGLMSKIDVDNLLGPDDNIVNNWSFASTKLERVGQQWKGMPSVPLVVGDNIYVRAGGMLYKLDAEHGTAEKHVESPGIVNFYHYISYGGGVIFDTISHKAFDLDLNYLYDLPSNLAYATYHDGFFYGYVLSDPVNNLYSIYKTSVDRDADLSQGVKVNLSKNTEKFMVFEQWGQHSPFIKQGEWMFFLQADKKTGYSGYRAITAYNVNTEKTVTKELGGISGMPWDDGWLTYGNGYFYITAYVAGLFSGIIEGLEDRYSTVLWVKFDFDKGQFEEPHHKDIETPSGDKFRGIASGLVIHNDRGYLNVRASPDDTMGHTNDSGTCMISFDISDDGTPIPKEASKSYMTHGGIVVNTAYESEGKIHVYMIPYESSKQGIYIFTDRLTSDGWVMDKEYSKKAPTHTQWCSQGIRAGPNGEILYYVDRGYIDSYIPDSRNKVTLFTMDGDSAISKTGFGQSAGVVISELFPSATISGDAVYIGNDKYVMYGLNEVDEYWKKISDPFHETWTGTENSGITVAPYHYVSLLKEGSKTHFMSFYDNGWYYQDEGGEFVKCYITDTNSIDKAIGKAMRYYNTNPSGLVLPNEIILDYKESETFTVSKTAPWTFSVLDESVCVVSDNGDGTMTISHKCQGTTELRISSGGREYTIDIVCLGGQYVDDDGYLVNSSEITGVDEEGNAFSTEILTKKKGTDIIIVENKTVVDSDGKILHTEVSTDRHDDAAYFDDEGNKVALHEKTNLKRDANGEIIESTEYALEKTVVVETDGTTVTRTSEAWVDNVEGCKTLSETQVTSLGMVEVENRCMTDKDGKTTESMSARFTSDEKTKVTITDEILEISLSGEFDVNISAMSELVNKDIAREVVVRAQSSISSTNLLYAYKADAKLECENGPASIVLGTDLLKKFGDMGGDLVFEASEADDSSINQKQSQAINGRQAFDLRLRCGDSEQHDFGKFTAYVKCDIDVKEGKVLHVWRIDEEGRMLPADNVSYSDGIVSFEADHLSIYLAGYEEDSNPIGTGDNTILIAGVVAAMVLAFVGFFVYKRHRVRSDKPLTKRGHPPPQTPYWRESLGNMSSSVLAHV